MIACTEEEKGKASAVKEVDANRTETRRRERREM